VEGTSVLILVEGEKRRIISKTISTNFRSRHRKTLKVLTKKEIVMERR